MTPTPETLMKLSSAALTNRTLSTHKGLTFMSLCYQGPIAQYQPLLWTCNTMPSLKDHYIFEIKHVAVSPNANNQCICPLIIRLVDLPSLSLISS